MTFNEIIAAIMLAALAVFSIAHAAMFITNEISWKRQFNKPPPTQLRVVNFTFAMIYATAFILLFIYRPS